MLNKRPIFVVGFARGGSNILLNLVRSHPQVCGPRGELHEVFKGTGTEPIATRLSKKLRYLPIRLKEGDFFDIGGWEDRKPLSDQSATKIDKILFQEKLLARDPGQNLYKNETEQYTDDEIKSARLVSKYLNGLIYVSRELHRMYPDATFLALVRNGYAVCEGHHRRGYNLQKFATHYHEACQRMLDDAAKIPNYHIFRYEDIMDHPDESLTKIYQAAGLDLSEVPKIRLQSKKVIGKDGKHNDIKERTVIWYPKDEFFGHFSKEANTNQIKRLKPEHKQLITDTCRASLEHFKYLQ